MNPVKRDGRRLGSVGRVLDGLELMVFGEDNCAQPSREVGEVAVRGPTVMLGYLDEDGYLFLTDRKKDIIIRGGENISPREVEEVLRT